MPSISSFCATGVAKPGPRSGLGACCPTTSTSSWCRPARTPLRAALAPLHRRYSWEINQREGWRGHLWQDRFASFPMDECHLHACLAYVELNPVRARLVARPADWIWSSARSHLGLASPGLADLDAARARIDDWRAFLDAGLDEADHKAIRAAERTGRWRTSKTGDAALAVPQS
ncbi:MAG: REP-associated tyrosine transposase [Sphingomonadales bacterium]|nr:REP-associated tyrosine transposase [Sphingomonadales bacterium]